MIENDTQYRVTVRAFISFTRSLIEMDTVKAEDVYIDPSLFIIQRAAIVSMIDEFSKIIEDYHNRLELSKA